VRRLDVAVVEPLRIGRAHTVSHSVINEPHLIIYFLINYPQVRYLLLDAAHDHKELLKFFSQGVHEDMDASGLPTWTIGKRCDPSKVGLGGSFTRNDLELVRLFVKPVFVESCNLAKEIQSLPVKLPYRAPLVQGLKELHQSGLL